MELRLCEVTERLGSRLESRRDLLSRYFVASAGGGVMQ